MTAQAIAKLLRKFMNDNKLTAHMVLRGLVPIMNGKVEGDKQPTPDTGCIR